MLEWILKYWLQVLFSAIIALVTGIFSWGYKLFIANMEKRNKEISKIYEEIKNLNNKMIFAQSVYRALLRDRMLQSYRYYLKQGSVTLSEKQTLCDLYYQYKETGGNGTMEHLFSLLDTLPIKEDRISSDNEEDMF